MDIVRNYQKIPICHQEHRSSEVSQLLRRRLVRFTDSAQYGGTPDLGSGYPSINRSISVTLRSSSLRSASFIIARLR